MQADVRAWMALARASVVKLSDHDADAAVLTALTTWFASQDAVTADQLPASLLSLLTNMGISLAAAETAGQMVLAEPMSGRTRFGAPSKFDGMTASRLVASEEPEMRAQYLLAAAKRLSDADVSDAALRRERRYLDMHVQMGRNRRRAARKVDELGSPILVWRTAGDDRVDPRCAALEGRLFTPGNPPGGAFPGAVHLRCRCHAAAWGHGPALNWGSRG